MVYGSLEHLRLHSAARNADVTISTLAIEHMQLQDFFQAAGNIVRNGGLLLVTNMHSDMGDISRHQVVDKEAGEAFCSEHYNHQIDVMISAANRASFELLILQEGVLRTLTSWEP